MPLYGPINYDKTTNTEQKNRVNIALFQNQNHIMDTGTYFWKFARNIGLPICGKSLELVTCFGKIIRKNGYFEICFGCTKMQISTGKSDFALPPIIIFLLCPC